MISWKTENIFLDLADFYQWLGPPELTQCSLSDVNTYLLFLLLIIIQYLMDQESKSYIRSLLSSSVHLCLHERFNDNAEDISEFRILSKS